MTDLESPRKNNDCYFYYYSKCAKGDSCTFRHEPSALGCETMCSFWKEGKCLNVHCNFRHMELRKNRKAIQCYWEAQPGGCLKPHCPFMHATGSKASGDESIDNKNDSGTESADNTMNEKLNHLSEKSFTPVDSLVVNFEEESDNESAPANSPAKVNWVNKIKTLEEIKLERIQAEQAAYYSYPDDGDDLRARILQRLTTSTTVQRKRPTMDCLEPEAAKKTKPNEVTSLKIKTLAEIRAERACREELKSENIICDNSVTSSNDLVQLQSKKVIQRIKLVREPPAATPTQSAAEALDEAEDEDMISTGIDAEKEVQEKSNKTIDEVLLLQEDDDNCNVSLKEEERLLNDDIEDILLD